MTCAKTTRALALALGAAALSADATVVNTNGILEVATAQELADAIEASGAGKLALGEGMLKWTGTGTTAVTGGFDGNAQSNLTVTVNVVNEGATLKIGGKVANTSKTPFVKTGPGTLEFTGTGVAGTENSFANVNYPWAEGFWKTYAAMTEGIWAPLETTWDENGNVYGGTTPFTVIEGAVRLNAPGEKFNITMMPWVGNRVQKSQTLEITNHTAVTSSGGWLSLSRGTGLLGNNAVSTVRITDGSSLGVSSLCMGNGNGAGNPYYARSVIEIDGGSKFSAGQIFQPENRGNAAIIAKNGSTVIGSDYQPDKGWIVQYDSSIELANSSTGMVRGLWITDNSTLTVTNKSVLAIDSILPSKRTDDTSRPNKVYFDDATLTTYKPGVADWFGNMNVGFANLWIGAGGLTFLNSRDAYFGSVPKSTKGPLVKRGAGTLYVPPFTNGLASIKVEGGKLGLVSQYKHWTNKVNGVITSASGNAFEIGGEGALGGRTFRPDGDLDLAVLPRGRVGGAEIGEMWHAVNYGLRHFDGTIQLTDADIDSSGAIWQKGRIDVTTNFTATFNTYAFGNNGTILGGWLFVLQTKDTSRCGGAGGNNGYNYGNTSQAFYADGCNSFGLGVAYNTSSFLVGKGKGTGKNTDTSIAAPVLLAPLSAKNLACSASAPARCTVKYDATAKKMSLTVYSPAAYTTKTFTRDIDLQTYLGATTAFVGIVAGTEWKSGYERGEFFFSDFQLNHGDAMAGTDAPLRMGGNVALGAGRTLKATVAGTRESSVYALDSLQGAGAVTLDVADAGINRDAPVTMPSSSRQDDWTFTGNGHWTADGPACAKLSESASGGVRTKRRYPVKGGSWEIAFTWRNGYNDASRAAADFLFISLGNDQPNDPSNEKNGFGIRCRMYNNGASCCWLNIPKNGTLQPIVEANGETKLDKTGTINFWSGKPVDFKLAYDDTAKKFVLTLTQNGKTATATVTGFDANAIFPDDEARLCFYQQVGGCQVKSVIANFSWTGACLDKALTGGRNTALAFDRISGVTALTKKGAADLAFLKPEGSSLPVTLEAGGLAFAKEPLQTFAAGVNGGWIFNTASGRYTAKNGVYIGSAVENNADNAQTRRRVRVAGKWRARWRMTTNGSEAADAMGFFIHNDPRGNQFTGGSHASCGILGSAQKIVSVTWYTHSTASSLNKMGVNTTGSASFTDSISPVSVRSTTPIDTTVEYDQATKQMKFTYVQGANTFTKTYSVDVVGTVGDDYAYLAFGTGGGGLHTYVHFDNFTFESLDASDVFAETRYVGSINATGESVSLTLDTPLAGGSFNVADTVKVAAGSVLTLRAPTQTAVAKMATLELGAGATVAGTEKVTLAPTTVAGAGAKDVTADGLVFVAPDSLEGYILRLVNGAKVRVSKALFLKAVYVDGVKQPSGGYTAAKATWIDAASTGSVITGSGSLMIVR